MPANWEIIEGKCYMVWSLVTKERLKEVIYHEAFDHHVTYSIHYSATRKGFRNQINNLWWKKRKEDAPENQGF
ncbi:unnamed protein product [Lactuca virosa]|uniref:Integrase zinc-binding domain-containing protein n=1 Tax=Lactuca virosa TaxID=75947 RepID=A0AAU9LXH6_9ASTR|nr:unnamed protein product [Lactuca virosa]